MKTRYIVQPEWDEEAQMMASVGTRAVEPDDDGFLCKHCNRTLTLEHFPNPPGSFSLTCKDCLIDMLTKMVDNAKR